MFSLVFFPSGFLEWDSFSDCAFSRSLPTCTFLLQFKTKLKEDILYLRMKSVKLLLVLSIF